MSQNLLSLKLSFMIRILSRLAVSVAVIVAVIVAFIHDTEINGNGDENDDLTIAKYRLNMNNSTNMNNI